MLSPETFATRWQSEVVTNIPEFIRDEIALNSCTPDAGALALIPEKSARFLVEAGLPKSCAPFLTFDAVGKGLPKLDSLWRLDGVAGFDTDFLSRYHVLGSDGAGNPLCIDTEEHGKIFMVDHDNAFRSRRLVASSVPQLAEALLIIHTQPREQFVALFKEIDPDACAPDSFLPAGVASLTGTFNKHSLPGDEE
jgi:hypothetical protein